MLHTVLQRKINDTFIHMNNSDHSQDCSHEVIDFVINLKLLGHQPRRPSPFFSNGALSADCFPPMLAAGPPTQTSSLSEVVTSQPFLPIFPSHHLFFFFFFNQHPQPFLTNLSHFQLCAFYCRYFIVKELL